MSAVVAAFHLDAMPISWHFFRTAGELVLNGAVLHVYSTHPQLQFGPFTFLVATPLSLLPTPVGAVIASLLMTGLGIATLTLMFKTLALSDLRASAAWWIGAAVALVAWAELAIRYGHLDDALALAFLAAALFALRRGHPAFAALLLAGSVDAKPWAVPAVALLLLAGTVLCDVALFRGRLPWATLAAAASVYAPTYLLTGLPALHAWVRTAGLIGVTIAVLVGAYSAERQRRANRVLAA